MEVVKFRDRLYKIICYTGRLKIVSLGVDCGNEQSLLVELSDGSRFQIIIVSTDRAI